MQLAGPGVWGPPRNVTAAIAGLRETVGGVNHTFFGVVAPSPIERWRSGPASALMNHLR